MAKGIFNGFAQRLLASAVCAFAFVSGGVQAAPIMAVPLFIAAGPNAGTGFALPNEESLGDGPLYRTRPWFFRLIGTSGYLTVIIDIQSAGALSTKAFLYAGDSGGQPFNSLSEISFVGPGRHFLNSFFVTAGYYSIKIQDTESSIIANGQGFFSLESQQISNVPIPATVALLGLGLVGIGAARRKQA